MHAGVCKFPIVLGNSRIGAPEVTVDVEDGEPVYRMVQSLSEALCSDQNLVPGVDDIPDGTHLQSDGRFVHKSPSTGEEIDIKVGLPMLDKRSFLDMIDVFFLDLDGVIWKGKKLLDNVDRTVEQLLVARKKKIFFVTNNATRTRDKVFQMLMEAGLFTRTIDKLKAIHGEDGHKAIFDEMMSRDKVYTSGWTAGLYLKRLGYSKNGKKVFVIGERGLREELELAGIVVIGADKPLDEYVDPVTGEMNVDKEIGAVVAGLDKDLTYQKIHYAFTCLTTLHTQFLATNIDAAGHFSSNQVWPGAAASVYALVGTTLRQPVLVGKPTGVMGACLSGVVNDPSRICMVGDRMDTDILFGHKCGFYTCLVMTGVASEKQLWGGRHNFDKDATHLYDMYQNAPPYMMPTSHTSQMIYDTTQTPYANPKQQRGHNIVPHFVLDGLGSLATPDEA